MIEILSLTFLILYSYIMYLIFKGLRNLTLKKKNYKIHSFSIIIPARNEEESIGNLLESILKQSYKSNNFEIVVINDRSSDATKEIVETYQKDNKNIHLINQEEYREDIAPKKAALIKGIAQSKNEIIVTTDADCTFKLNWLETINTYYNENVDVLCAPVTFNRGKRTFWNRIQELDFLSLIATSAGGIGINEPVICNGANFSFRKSAYEKMNGFENLPHITAGEDDQLLYKFKEYNFNIDYCWNTQALAFTTPIEQLKVFFNQRKRWGAMDVKKENNQWTYRLYIIYLFNLSLFILALNSLFNLEQTLLFGATFLIKFLVELPIIFKVIKLVQKPILWLFSPIVTLLQIPYVVIVGALANLTSHSWKN